MPFLDSNDPRAFGWTYPPTDLVPFVYSGHSFPQGVSALAHRVFTAALDRICSVSTFRLHTGSGLDDGDWGAEDRSIAGNPTGTHSFHAYGLALDVNAPWNPQGTNPPPASVYRMPTSTQALVEPLGILWGGSARFGSRRDWMHLEVHASPAELAAAAASPTPRPSFPLPPGWYYGPYSGPTESVSGSGRFDGPYRAGLRWAQGRLGTTQDGLYGPLTAAVTATWQTHHGLTVDGLIGRATWSTL